ncbi:MFS transporter [Capsulimonas corticalis]|uniref:MFS transporter n=1 Tax=Capsulimonas corticalis TaxID=2219043 RepID=A0A402CY87_9BACT|nr:MFS transporter [Capsulimonas corticalis]BDI31432.1 MFS transporter [Capsulimonas corticalis]
MSDHSATIDPASRPRKHLLDMNGYQWAVLFAAWLGWGFDVFDGLLFNFVAPNCVPTLLHLRAGSDAAKHATAYWTGVATSILLIGWAMGGIVFGKIADRIGRSRTLMLTILLYAGGTAACAIAPSLPLLLLFRFIASLGIGGEWAAGASLVAEVVPEKRRVEAGALLYTSAPFGLFFAVFVNSVISTVYFADRPESSWRYVLACGLIPAAFAFFVRSLVKEPEVWERSDIRQRGRIRELFTPQYRSATLSGFIPALTILITWWTCNAFLQVIAADMALATAAAQGLTAHATTALKTSWITLGSNAFNCGGLLGTLLTIPAAKYLGRRTMFGVYFLGSAAALFTAFGHRWDPITQLWLFFPIGVTVFGVFGACTYYLPELFPTRLRATGAGFCYNAGRFITAIGPFIVGSYAKAGPSALGSVLHILCFVAAVPIIGLMFLPWVIETKNRVLED